MCYGRVTAQTYEDGDTVSYTYDNSGALATVKDSVTGITTTYYYDLSDRLMKYVEKGTGYNHSVEYTYDKLNNLTKQTEIVNGAVHTSTYTYDDDNRVTTSTKDGVTVSYTYDSLGRVTTQTTKNGSTTILTESYTYKVPTAGATSAQIATYTTAAPNGYSVTYSYTYDENGNILSISDGSHTTSYAYDTANQLVRENNEAEGKTWTWDYDAAGNILIRKEYGYTTAALGAASDTVAYTYGDDDWGDLLTAYDGSGITYDAIGNPESFDGWDFVWEHGRQLASMSDDTTTWTHTYNADGLRTKRTDGTNTYSYVYNGSQLMQMKKGSDTLNFTYDAGGVPLTVTHNGIVYYYVTNLQGDITAIVDTAGTNIATYTYDAWGNPIGTANTSTIASLNPLRYRGYVYDTETGMYYLQSRYYNPKLGRFLNADVFFATGQGMQGNNMFAYCLNNPVRYRDVNGDVATEAVLCTLYEVVIVVGFVVVVYFLGKAIYTSLDYLIGKLNNSMHPFSNTVEDNYIDSIPEIVVPTPLVEEVSTKGKENMRDTGLSNVSDDEVQQKARDKRLPSSERQRYKKEEKARGLRNVTKRRMNYSVPEGGFRLGGK